MRIVYLYTYETNHRHFLVISWWARLNRSNRSYFFIFFAYHMQASYFLFPLFHTMNGWRRTNTIIIHTHTFMIIIMKSKYDEYHNNSEKKDKIEGKNSCWDRKSEWHIDYSSFILLIFLICTLCRHVISVFIHSFSQPSMDSSDFKNHRVVLHTHYTYT